MIFRLNIRMQKAFSTNMGMDACNNTYIGLGAQMKGGTPSTIFRFRLDAAYDYLIKNPDTTCIVSGGKGTNETVSEGDGGYIL